MADLDIEQITAFRKAHVGKTVEYSFRAIGENDWSTTKGQIGENGVTITEGDYKVYYDFPNAQFEYRRIRVVGNDGATLAQIDPTPPTSRVQSRAASLERATIHQGVQQAADEGRAERLALANLLAEMRESSAAERRQLLEEQRVANAAAAAERLQMQQLLAQVAQATTALQHALASQRATPAQATTTTTTHAPPPATATPATATPTTADDATIGGRFEGDVHYPGKWDLSTPEAVRLKRLEVMQTFGITNRSSAFRQRAFNVLSAWMDNAYEQGEWNEALVQVGVVAMENLRSCVATEDLKVNARDLFTATATPASDKLGEAISTLAKEAEKRGRSRGRGRQDGHGYGRSNFNNNNSSGTYNTNNNNNNNNSYNNAGRGRGQGNFRGPAQQ